MQTSIDPLGRTSVAAPYRATRYNVASRTRDRGVHTCLHWLLALTCTHCVESTYAEDEQLRTPGIADQFTYQPAEQPAARPTGWLVDWRDLPVAQCLRLQGFTSHDPGTLKVANIDQDNKDFNNFLAVCGDRPPLRDQRVGSLQCDVPEGYVIAAADGPGVVTRIFFPATASGGFGGERIRIFVDDLSKPTIDAALLDWRNGTDAPPLTAWTSGALVSHAPITYQNTLRIVLDALEPSRLYYYHVDVQHGHAAETRPLSELTADFAELRQRVRDATDAEIHRSNSTVVSAHDEAVLLDEIGAGTLLQLALHVQQPSWGALRSLALRITWDDAESPAVDLPLAALWGFFDRPVSFETLPLWAEVHEDAVDLALALPMPFFKHARVSLVNDSATAHAVEVQLALSRSAPDPRSEYLHVQRTRTRAPFASGQRHPIAAITGQGKYVGTLAQLRGRADPDSATPFPLGFLEGDERIIVDGATALEGTGTEDYFDAGWYFQDGTFSHDFAALIDHRSDDTSQRGRANMLRWHALADAIEFHESFEMSLEYGANRPNSALEYITNAFYYLSEP